MEFKTIEGLAEGYFKFSYSRVQSDLLTELDLSYLKKAFTNLISSLTPQQKSDFNKRIAELISDQFEGKFANYLKKSLIKRGRSEDFLKILNAYLEKGGTASNDPEVSKPIFNMVAVPMLNYFLKKTFGFGNQARGLTPFMKNVSTGNPDLDNVVRNAIYYSLQKNMDDLKDMFLDPNSKFGDFLDKKVSGVLDDQELFDTLSGKEPLSNDGEGSGSNADNTKIKDNIKKIIRKAKGNKDKVMKLFYNFIKKMNSKDEVLRYADEVESQLGNEYAALSAMIRNIANEMPDVKVENLTESKLDNYLEKIMNLGKTSKSDENKSRIQLYDTINYYIPNLKRNLRRRIWNVIKNIDYAQILDYNTHVTKKRLNKSVFFKKILSPFVIPVIINHIIKNTQELYFKKEDDFKDLVYLLQDVFKTEEVQNSISEVLKYKLGDLVRNTIKDKRDLKNIQNSGMKTLQGKR